MLLNDGDCSAQIPVTNMKIIFETFPFFCVCVLPANLQGWQQKPMRSAEDNAPRWIQFSKQVRISRYFELGCMDRELLKFQISQQASPRIILLWAIFQRPPQSSLPENAANRMFRANDVISGLAKTTADDRGADFDASRKAQIEQAIENNAVKKFARSQVVPFKCDPSTFIEIWKRFPERFRGTTGNSWNLRGHPATFCG